MSTFTLYPGCLVTMRYPGFEVAARKVAEAFGFELTSCDGFSCCPDPVWIRSTNEESWLTLAARNLSIAEAKGFPLLTLCNGCFETLKTASVILQNDGKKKEKVNENLRAIGREYQGQLEVKHMVQALYEEIGPDALKEKTVRSFNGVKAACHPGCHYMRPSRIAQVDDPVNPHVLEEMVQALGLETVDYKGKTLCCGLPIFQTDRELSLKLAYKKLDLMKDADFIVVTCPSCFSQFETAQMLRKKEKSEENGKTLPVFHYIELLALALGVPPSDLMFEVHRIPVQGVLQKMGVS